MTKKKETHKRVEWTNLHVHPILLRVAFNRKNIFAANNNTMVRSMILLSRSCMFCVLCVCLRIRFRSKQFALFKKQSKHISCTIIVLAFIVQENINRILNFSIAHVCLLLFFSPVFCAIQLLLCHGIEIWFWWKRKN